MEVIQQIINALGLSGLYVVFTLGMMIIYSTLRILHIAHGSVIVISGYATFLTYLFMNNIFVATIIAIFVGIAAGLIIHKGVYEPLILRGAGPLMTLVASVAVYIATEQICLLLFGRENKFYPTAFNSATVNIFGMTIFVIQLIALILGITMALVTWTILKKTKQGFAIRAVVQDLELASTMGINPKRVYLFATIIGSAYAGLAGSFYTTYINNVYPFIGFDPVIISMAAVVLGGMGSIFGAVLASMIIAFIETFTFVFIELPFPRITVAFIVLLITLAIRPYGLFGKKEG